MRSDRSSEHEKEKRKRKNENRTPAARGLYSFFDLPSSFVHSLRKLLSQRTPVDTHFVNPLATIQNVSYNADGSIRALNGFGSITGTNNVGREYDERYMRIGARLSW
jgi:hypothetical protein